MHSLRTLTVVTWMLLALPAGAEEMSMESRQDSPVGVPAELDRSARHERNLRISFSSGAADRARTYLLGTSGSPVSSREVRRVGSALLTLGASGTSADLDLLESYAQAEKLSLRRAALYAIGEFGVSGFATLDRVLAGPLVGAEEAAMLALIHMDQTSSLEPRVALQRVLDACDDPRLGVSQAALFLRDYALGGPAPAALPALDSYYDLRWSAACAFGFVDGLRWRDLKLNALLEDPIYTSRLVLELASGLDQSMLGSHLIELMAYDHGPGCAAGMILGLPGVLPALYEDAGWRPDSVLEWTEVIGAIELLDSIAGYEVLLADGLKLFFGSPDLEGLRDRVALLLLGAGKELPQAWMKQAIASQDHHMQSRLLGIAGGIGTDFMLSFASRILASSKSPVIAIKAQLALARMGDQTARSDLSALLREARPNVRLMVLEAMGEVSYDPQVRAWLRELTAGLELVGEARHALSFALARTAPSENERVHLRAALRFGGGTPASRLRVLSLLLADPKPQDLELFEELFPVEGQLEFNLKLARALANPFDAHTQVVLRRVLWGGQWNLGVIAGGVARLMYGTSFLMDELATPPAHATDEHLRSVGFSLGEWAGLGAVEELARTQTARDAALQGAFLGALSASGQ